MRPCFRNFGNLVASVFLMGFTLSWGAETTIKTAAVVGEVTLQKAGVGDWIPVRVGSKAKQADKVRTAVESQVSFQFGDGSVVTIAENSIVELKTLISGEGASNTKLGVKTGKVLFNIQKLANARSTFEFETQTATAAIRGTEGDVQVNGSRSLASLLTGKLELFSTSGRASIGPGQMALQTPTGFVVLPKPKDPRSYQQLVDKFLKDTTSTVDSMVNDIRRKLDSLGVENLADSTQDSTADTTTLDSVPNDTTASKVTSCIIDGYPSETSEARILVTGKVPEGAEVGTGAIKVKSVGGVWKMDLAWSPDRFGPRAYPITAMVNGVKIDCGEVKFVYAQKNVPLALKLNMPNPSEVCRGPLTLSGNYSGSGARLVAKLGSMSVDLSNSTGAFTKAIPVSDQTRNWDIERVEFVLSNSENSISQSVDVRANRTCRDVNRIAPVILASMQPTMCLGSLGISAVQGDEVKVSILADGAEIENFSTTTDVRGRRINLQEGEHSYVIRAFDLAGNKAEQTFPRVTCWPDVRFDIALAGPSREVLRIPPPPPGRVDRVSKSLEFAVKNLPRDDFRYLKSVTIRQDGRILKEWRQTQIRDVQFSADIELARGKPNQIKIEVETQNGRIRSVVKEYEFR